MKNILLFILVLFSIEIFAQTIPYATQQPKWVFPVYAKDATGKRDTIYLGYNPGASTLCDSESNMGEIWFTGVNDFSLATSFWLDPLDSIIKTNIRDVTPTLYYDCGNAIVLSNVVMPVTFYWDVSLMRSDSLPFPDQDPLPRAQLNIGFNAEQVVNESGISCNTSYPIIVSDTIDTPFCNCYVKDSLHFIDLFGTTSPQTFVLTFEFTPWVGHRPDLGVSENNKLNISIYPNPVSDKITVLGLNYDKYELTILDLQFRKISGLIYQGSSPVIPVTTMDTGIYLLAIENENSYQVIKFIKE